KAGRWSRRAKVAVIVGPGLLAVLYFFILHQSPAVEARLGPSQAWTYLGLQGTTEDGEWLPPEGCSLIGPVYLFRQRPFIHLRGPSVVDRLGGKLPGVRATLVVPNQPRVLTPSSGLAPAGGEFLLAVALDPDRLPKDGRVEIRFPSDHWFVPKHEGLNADARELVLLAPHSISLFPAPKRPAAAEGGDAGEGGA